MRKRVIAGNWKMNMTGTEAKKFLKKIVDKINTNKKEIVLCVPSIDIPIVNNIIKNTKIKLGAENFYFENRGAYTGEISAEMLLDQKVSYVIIGHSERRQIFKETNKMINKKVIKAVEENLIPIICCGETLKQREKGETLSHIKKQIEDAYKGVDEKYVKKTIIAYEPIWAIGTGKTATADEAEDVCSYIRKLIKNLYDEKISQEIRILYGGSVNKNNAKEIFSKENIDGGLIGGASIKEDFIDIVKA